MCAMIAVVYRCPATGLSVDHWFEPADKAETYESVLCRACNHVHLVNVTSGRVLVGNREEFTPLHHAKT
jgi:hypothetical protein